MPNPNVHLVMLMADLGCIIAAQTSVTRIAACLKGSIWLGQFDGLRWDNRWRLNDLVSTLCRELIYMVAILVNI